MKRSLSVGSSLLDFGAYSEWQAVGEERGLGAGGGGGGGRGVRWYVPLSQLIRKPKLGM